MFLRHVAVQLD